MIKMSTNPLPSTNKSLALNEICEETALNSHDMHSLHLKSLVEHYLEPSSPSTASHLPLFHSLFNQHHPHCEDLHQSFIHELQNIMQTVGAYYVELRREVMRATKKAEIRMHSHGPPCSNDEHLKVVVLGHLRSMGFNAAICTSKRDPLKNQHKGYFPAEEYEYMDVILEKGNNTQDDARERVIIDLRFRSEFEIARPSNAYVELLKVVPIVYVGSPRVLQKLLSLLSEAIRSSLQSQGMPLPPWRRLPFLHSKWLSPHYSRSNFAPTYTHPNSTIKKSSSSFISTKRDNALSPISTKRENALSSTNTSSSSSISKRENSLFIINYLPSTTATKPYQSVNGMRKRVLESFALTTHVLPSNNIIVENGSNKQLTKVGFKPIKEPWQLSPLSNPPLTSIQHPRRLVGALTQALQCGSNSMVMSVPFNNLQFSLSANFS